MENTRQDQAIAFIKGAVLLTMAVGFLPVWGIVSINSWEATTRPGILLFAILGFIGTVLQVGFLEAVTSYHLHNIFLLTISSITGGIIGLVRFLTGHKQAGADPRT